MTPPALFYTTLQRNHYLLRELGPWSRRVGKPRTPKPIKRLVKGVALATTLCTGQTASRQR